MQELHTALALLAEKYGEIDNVKLLLGDATGMSPESVEAELYRFAEGVHSGEFSPQETFLEDKLKSAKIAI